METEDITDAGLTEDEVLRKRSISRIREMSRSRSRSTPRDLFSKDPVLNKLRFKG
jgi:hypothetical protein